jgi:hypothetical protein
MNCRFDLGVVALRRTIPWHDCGKEPRGICAFEHACTCVEGIGGTRCYALSCGVGERQSRG